MAKISLRVYNREIEGLIESGQLEEAIAHCQHILKTYAMHIETYQLLGKAFLEAHRYADAADIFQRILNVVPDDFVSHVGMSIIRDDEGRLDESIWHMERAFEIQPSNPAIQGELRRLYGRRDGVEPPKIRLSRDALANMYAQGELFNQAIAEIRAILADEPDRPDLQVMLARAYFRAEQKVEATDIAAKLLKKYPYCRDALRILVEVLPGTGRAENIQVYRQRLNSIDPYTAFVTGPVFASEQVTDASVTLERLEYKADQSLSHSQPAWAATLGVQLEEKQDTAKPLWLESGQEEPTGSKALSQSSTDNDKNGDTIPEFLRAAGWSDAGEPASQAVVTPSTTPGEDAIKGDVPDWLKAQIPPELADIQESGEKTRTESSDDFPAWLTDMTGANKMEDKPETTHMEPGHPEDIIKTEATTTRIISPEATSEITSVISDFQHEEPGRDEMLPGDKTELPSLGKDEPDWLRDFSMASPSEDETDSSKFESEKLDIPGWLDEEKVEELPKISDSPIPESTSEAIIPTSASGSADLEMELPDWLRDPDEPKSPSAIPAVLDNARQDDAGAWVFVEGNRADEIETKPLPELGKELTASEEPGSAEIADTHPKGDEPSRPVEIGDDTLAWLEGLAAKQGARQEELLTKPEERSFEIPSWLQGTTDGNAQEDIAQGQSLDGQVASASLANDERQPVEQEYAHGAEGILAPSEAMITREPDIDNNNDEITSWLKDLDKTAERESAPQNPAESPLTLSVQSDIPDWLKELDKPITPETSEAEEIAGISSNDLPDWLQEIGESKSIADEVRVLEEGSAPPMVEELADNPARIISEEWTPIEAIAEVPEPSWEKFSGEDSNLQVPEQVKQAPEQTEQVPEHVVKIAANDTQSPASFTDKDSMSLSTAQNALVANNLNESMKGYSSLIRKGRLLDDVIHDLREATYRFPVDVLIWQTLGDAYMRANRLQDALDSYTKAEELLR